MYQALLVVSLFVMWVAEAYLLAAMFFYRTPEGRELITALVVGIVCGGTFYLAEKATVTMVSMLIGAWPKVLGFGAAPVGVAVGFLLFYLSGSVLRRMELPTKLVTQGLDPYRANHVRVLDTDSATAKLRVFLWEAYLEDSQMLAEAIEPKAEKG